MTMATIVVTEAEVTNKVWNCKGRIVSLPDLPKAPAGYEHWMSLLKIIGAKVQFSYSGEWRKGLSLRSGMLISAPVPEPKVSEYLETVAFSKEKPPTISLTPDRISPMREPCVRVPLSLLKELRGQEAEGEQARKSLVDAWSYDRKTGKDI